MKWLVVLCALFAFLCFCMAQSVDQPNVDYTDRYAELASPVPANVDVDELVATLREASNHP
uniref:Seminal fluid protein HACP021 n=1 Tax=Heliconius erato TaxID=33431 RepID=D9HQ36_HELEA|nr:seminal fluid protein HACP021 [Heliconius erato]ADJ58544.1 seminal fluid protein HACP053 [Heliconius erato]